MIEKLKRRFDKRRLVLIFALILVSLYVGWRTGSFSGEPEQPPCVPGRNEIKDEKGTVIQVIRTTCIDD